jgi:hypothetical protein
MNVSIVSSGERKLSLGWGKLCNHRKIPIYIYIIHDMITEVIRQLGSFQPVANQEVARPLVVLPPFKACLQASWYSIFSLFVEQLYPCDLVTKASLVRQLLPHEDEDDTWVGEAIRDSFFPVHV